MKVIAVLLTIAFSLTAQDATGRAGKYEVTLRFTPKACLPVTRGRSNTALWTLPVSTP